VPMPSEQATTSNSARRLAGVLALIDAANAADPNTVATPQGERPAELVYGERMSATLGTFLPDASEHLAIAVRGQHIERWTSPRAAYPDGRIGYLKWRKDLKDHHAARVGALMAEVGYAPADIARVASLIRKERLKHDAEAQTLEDVVCLVFLRHYAESFIAKHDDDKVVDILAKTAVKMSKAGLEAASKLALPERLGRLIGVALAR
jgi:Domain of unknown function (DUF4202)